LSEISARAFDAALKLPAGSIKNVNVVPGLQAQHLAKVPCLFRFEAYALKVGFKCFRRCVKSATGHGLFLTKKKNLELGSLSFAR
jgi:hypothetical protein